MSRCLLRGRCVGSPADPRFPAGRDVGQSVNSGTALLVLLAVEHLAFRRLGERGLTWLGCAKRRKFSPESTGQNGGRACSSGRTRLPAHSFSLDHVGVTNVGSDLVRSCLSARAHARSRRRDGRNGITTLDNYLDMNTNLFLMAYCSCRLPESISLFFWLQNCHQQAASALKYPQACYHYMR